MIAASFSLGARQSERTVIDALRRRFGCRPEGHGPVRVGYIDTIDWRLYREGLVLSLVGEGQAVTLSLSSLAGRPLHRLPVDPVPLFAGELPAGPLREALEPITENRRLLRRVALELEVAVHAVVDASDKSVARVAIERGEAQALGLAGEARTVQALAPSLSVLTLVGYEREGRQVERFFSYQARLESVEPSPLRRALAIVELEPHWVASPPAYSLGAGMPAADALREILRVTFHSMRCNEQGLLHDVDVECVHDFRVATRRTRAALGQLKHIFAPAAVDRFAGEFRWLQRRTGPLRDADVFMECMPAYRKQLPVQTRPDVDVLERQLLKRRRRALRKATATLRSARYARLVDEWSAFLDEPDERADSARDARLPVATIAARRIRKVYRRLERRGSAIRDSSPASRLHELRMDAKKLRYLLEFFAVLYPRGEVVPLIRSLKKLQDVLGDFNDLDVQQLRLIELAEELEAGEQADAARRVVTALVEQMRARQHALRQRFASSFARFVARRRQVERMLGPGEAIA